MRGDEEIGNIAKRAGDALAAGVKAREGRWCVRSGTRPSSSGHHVSALQGLLLTFVGCSWGLLGGTGHVKPPGATLSRASAVGVLGEETWKAAWREGRHHYEESGQDDGAHGGVI